MFTQWPRADVSLAKIKVIGRVPYYVVKVATQS